MGARLGVGLGIASLALGMACWFSRIITDPLLPILLAMLAVGIGWASISIPAFRHRWTWFARLGLIFGGLFLTVVLLAALHIADIYPFG